ncbi:MAG: RidA family protein [Anaeromyxobacter sp.]|nr:RidA family protein [Anaeromyxobacter sp.]MBL0276794.1 RidA family protein [Anaeromyxobacter sp.]
MPSHQRHVIATADAPRAIGPYSQAVSVPAPALAGLLFLSGQIPLDPATGELVKGTIEEETRRVMENLRAVLSAGQAGFQDVVKTTIYLTDLSDFTRVNEVYGSYFPAHPPARATVQVAALPRGARVEIDAIAAPGL